VGNGFKERGNVRKRHDVVLSSNAFDDPAVDGGFVVDAVFVVVGIANDFAHGLEFVDADVGFGDEYSERFDVEVEQQWPGFFLLRKVPLQCGVGRQDDFELRVAVVADVSEEVGFESGHHAFKGEDGGRRRGRGIAFVPRAEDVFAVLAVFVVHEVGGEHGVVAGALAVFF